MRIGHISDLHHLDMSGAQIKDFFNKRITGGLNLLLGRKSMHQSELTEKALSILQKEVDHLVVTGDITNLALQSEFDAVRELLYRYFNDENMSIIPGNHDFYTKESITHQRFEKTIYQNQQNELQMDGILSTWPFVKLRGEIAIIGLNSAAARPWFNASGVLGKSQRKKLKRYLEHPEVKDKFKILCLHHHIFQTIKAPGEQYRNLKDRDRFLALIEKHPVDLIVHGHNHVESAKFYQNTLISEAGSVSENGGKVSPRRGKFKIYEVKNRQLNSVETWKFDDKDFALHTTTLIKDNSLEVTHVS